MSDTNDQTAVDELLDRATKAREMQKAKRWTAATVNGSLVDGLVAHLGSSLADVRSLRARLGAERARCARLAEAAVVGNHSSDLEVELASKIAANIRNRE